MQLVTTILVAMNIIVFLLMYRENAGSLWNPSTDLLLRAGAGYGPLIAHGQWWRILSCGFVHVGIIHLGLNMYALSSLGGSVERQFGALKYLLIYFISMVAGSLLSQYIHPYVISAGASGAIFGLLGCQTISLLGLWSKMPKLQLFGLLVNDGILIGLYFAIGFFVPRIDNFAHLGGLLGGIAAGLALLPPIAKLPNVFNIGGIIAIVMVLAQANAFVTNRDKEATDAMTANQSTRIAKILKEDKLPFWWPSRIGSPVEALGSAALQCTDYKAALALADKEVDMNKENGHAYYTRALVQHKFNHDAEAQADADQAISLVPDDYEFYLLRARILLMLKHPKEALSDVHAALQTEHKDNAEAQDVSGCCHLAEGNNDEALRYFDKAISEDAQLGDAYYHRAIAYRRAGDPTRAEQDFIRAQECNFVPGEWEKEQLEHRKSLRDKKAMRGRKNVSE